MPVTDEFAPGKRLAVAVRVHDRCFQNIGACFLQALDFPVGPGVVRRNHFRDAGG